MTTPTKNYETKVTLKELDEVLQHVVDDGEEEMTFAAVRAAFFISLMKKASDGLLLWMFGTTCTPKSEASIARTLREEPNAALAMGTISSAIRAEENNVGGRLQQVVDLIINDRSLHDELFSVLPRKETKQDDLDFEPEDNKTKVEEILASASQLPNRVGVTTDGKDRKYYWAITQADGVETHVPVEHPDVQHLEELNSANVPLTLSNVVKPDPGKRKSFGAEDTKPKKMEPPKTRKTTLEHRMALARDTKVCNAKHEIPKRQNQLRQVNPGLGPITIGLRALGWAKYHIEACNRFQPEEKRFEVTQIAWEKLFGPNEFNLSTKELISVDVHYNRYKSNPPHSGYHHQIHKDGHVAK
jgi:hypothetical protein